jgi:ABC-2 type transport system permease protein
MRAVVEYAKLTWAYLRLNLAGQLAYRGAFVSQVAAMFVNDLIWVVFWVLFFTRFQVLRGWTVADVVTVWALAAAGFGLAHAVWGNVVALPGMIARGELDVWMLYPRPLLAHLLLGKSDVTAWGDVLFGYAVYAWFVRPDLPHLALFAVLSLAVAALFVGLGVLVGSLGFYLGNATILAEQWTGATITFATYPSPIFTGAIKVVLFTVVPAGFINQLPVEALRTLSLRWASLTLLGSLAFVGLGVLVFRRGMRRYESGNLLAMRG